MAAFQIWTVDGNGAERINTELGIFPTMQAASARLSEVLCVEPAADHGVSPMSNAAVRLASGIVARRYRILTTNTWVYEAVEPTHPTYINGRLRSCYCHSTICSFDGEEFRHAHGLNYGKLVTRDLPAEIEILTGKARHAAYDAWRAGLEEEAYNAILAAFPEAASGARKDGGIDLVIDGTSKNPR